MNPATFDYLLNLIYNDLQKMGTNWRTPISPEERNVVAISDHLLKMAFLSLWLGSDESDVAGTEQTAVMRTSISNPYWTECCQAAVNVTR